MIAIGQTFSPPPPRRAYADNNLIADEGLDQLNSLREKLRTAPAEDLRGILRQIKEIKNAPRVRGA